MRSMVWNGLTEPPRAAPGVGELARDEGHVLADDDLGFLVVQRQQVGSGEHIAAAAFLQEARQKTQHIDAIGLRSGTNV